MTTMLLRAPVSRLCRTAVVQQTTYRSFHASLALNDKTIKLLPTQVVIAAYTKVDAADDAANALKASRDVICKNIAVIRKNDEGKLKITEMGKIRKSLGAAVGALVAGTSVLLLGPIAVAGGAVGGALAGAAAAVGARAGATVGAYAAMQGTMLAQATATIGGGIAGTYAATKIETLNPEKMNQLGNILQRDQSAIIAVFDQVVVPMDKLDAEEQTKRDEILTKIGRDIGNTLQEGEDVAFRIAVTDDEGIVATRMATGIEAADISQLVIKGDAVKDDGDEDDEVEEEITYDVHEGVLVEGGEDQAKEAEEKSKEK